MAVIRQGGFSGGELAPQMWGRTDLAIRARGLRRCRNFFVSHQGALVSRPGTSYVATTKDSFTRQVRLVPFIYSDAQSYVLEFGENYIRIFSNAARVTPVDGGVATEIVTTYTEAQLRRLKFAAVGDVMTIVHPDHPPRELKRLAHTSWTLTAVNFDRPWPNRAPNGDSGTTPTNASSDGLKLLDPVPAGDIDRPAREWRWQVTQVFHDSRGFAYESRPFTITHRIAAAAFGATPYTINTVPDKTAVYRDMPVTIQIAAPGGFPSAQKHRIYRGRGDVFGWVGDTDTLTFTDVGNEPDYTFAPPKGENPFKVYDNTGALLRTEYPATVAFFEERRVFGDTLQRPAYLFVSATGDYANFDRALLATSEDAGEWDLAARQREEIRSIVSLNKMLLLTNASVWSFGGGGGEPLSPAPGSIPDAKRLLDIGSSWVDPLVVANKVLMLRAKGSGVRDLFYDFQAQTFSGGDVSAPASHLFDNKAILAWAYAEDPWGLVWAVRDDGALLSLTYEREAGVWAWARHDTLGIVEDVCCVPEGDEDAVYLVVRRTVNGNEDRFIERMASRVLPEDGSVGPPGSGVDGKPDVAETIALDSSVTYRGAMARTMTGLGHLEGVSVMALADGVVAGPYLVTTGTIDLSDIYPDVGSGATVIHAGLTFTPEIVPLDLAQDGAKRKTVTEVVVEVDSSRGLSVGEDEEHLVEWRQRSMPTGYAAVGAGTEVVRIRIKSSWNENGRVLLRQTDPLFVTIYGLSRVLQTGD